MAIQSFQDLTVWQKSFELVEKVYQCTSQLPVEERYGIISQLQRSAISVPSNIAEGFSRNNRREFSQFIGIARGSAAELETQLLIVKKVYKTDVEIELELLTEVRKMLTSLSQKIRV